MGTLRASGQPMTTEDLAADVTAEPSLNFYGRPISPRVDGTSFVPPRQTGLIREDGRVAFFVTAERLQGAAVDAEPATPEAVRSRNSALASVVWRYMAVMSLTSTPRTFSGPRSLPVELLASEIPEPEWV